MDQVLTSGLVFLGDPAVPSIFAERFGSGDWGKLATGEYEADKSEIFVPYERVWVFDQFPE